MPYDISVVVSNVKDVQDARVIAILEDHTDPLIKDKRKAIIEKLGRERIDCILKEKPQKELSKWRIGWDLPDFGRMFEGFKQRIEKIMQACKLILQPRKNCGAEWDAAWNKLSKIPAKMGYPECRFADERREELAPSLKLWADQYIIEKVDKFNRKTFPKRQSHLIETLERFPDKRLLVYMGFQHGDRSRTAFPCEVDRLNASLSKREYAFLYLQNSSESPRAIEPTAAAAASPE